MKPRTECQTAWKFSSHGLRPLNFLRHDHWLVRSLVLLGWPTSSGWESSRALGKKADLTLASRLEESTQEVWAPGCSLQLCDFIARPRASLFLSSCVLQNGSRNRTFSHVWDLPSVWQPCRQVRRLKAKCCRLCMGGWEGVCGGEGWGGTWQSIARAHAAIMPAVEGTWATALVERQLWLFPACWAGHKAPRWGPSASEG